ncbi:MAG: Gldg family protein [Methylococcaceae bacterium]
MQPSVFKLAKKEIAGFFSSPVAFIFFAAFLLITLFIFFWVETFFARNIADVRPLFEWMPVLMIFLVAALTMRMWSEERRTGTLEFLLTQPVSPLRFVLGKFLACLALVAMALILTLPLPITLSFLGDLDWGPIFGAYLATLLLAAAYTSIGLTVSARTDNQIVSLIVTVLICSFFYLLGADKLTGLFGNEASELFKSLGTGSRFESITRGVLDIRDCYYYLSLIGVFLCLNSYFLESGRWAKDSQGSNHQHWQLLTGLFVANFIMGNVWLSQINKARIDLTEGQQYSISPATINYLEQLNEPLLIRGFFSAKTHPLLAPLVPQIRDLLTEYQIAANGKIRTEFIDPLENPELEKEAGEKYGIRPVPFQVTDKYQASVVNSYFDVLIQYGDQYQVLGFKDLIEVKSQSEADLDVQLRNPEYEITRSIKKILNQYQSGGNLFSGLDEPLKFTGYISEDTQLPEVLVELKKDIISELEEFKATSNGKFDFTLTAPDAGDGKVAQQISDEFGFQPMRAGLFDTTSFYFYMLLENKGQPVQVPLPKDLSKDSFKTSVEGAIKRYSSGFMKTLAIYTPRATPPNPLMQQMRMPSGKQFNVLQEKLKENHLLANTDLTEGTISESADFLFVAAPDKLTDVQVFAMDQFLMKGGTVLLASSSFSADMTGGTLAVAEQKSGVNEWLKHYGITVDKSMVLDPQNAMLPIPVQRNLGGYTVQELQMVEYPYFVDIRQQGLAEGGAITSGLPQVTFNWASPLVLDQEKTKSLKVTKLLSSSNQAWTSDSTTVVPDFEQYQQMGFAPGDKRQSYLLAASIEGRFESFFKGKDSPLLEYNDPAKKGEEKAEDETKQSKKEKPQRFSSVIEKSPESARIIVFASNDFLADQTISLAASGGGSEYLNTLQLVENTVDWSLEDQGLLSIRSRSHFARTLFPLSQSAQRFWEYMNYGLSLLGLLVIYLIFKFKRRKAHQHYQQLLSGAGNKA